MCYSETVIYKNDWYHFKRGEGIQYKINITINNDIFSSKNKNEII